MGSELDELFQWCVTQSEPAAQIPPLAIHQSSMPRDHTGLKCNICENGVVCIHKAQIIKARPFTIAFERYVDGEDEEAPILQALADIHSDPSMVHPHGLEFELCWAIVIGGHTDLDGLRAVLGHPNGLDEALRRGLTLLRDKTTAIVQKQVAETSQRRERAGDARRVREEDGPKKKRKSRMGLRV